MSFFTEIVIGDCSEFINALEAFIDRLINIYDRYELYIIRVDNWFDHKWLGFAGKTLDIYDVNFPDITISPAIWRSRNDITLPPFSPNRIIKEEKFIVHKDKVESIELDNEIHSLKKRPSEQNLNNHLLNYCDNGMFLWFSSQSESNGRASILVYHTLKDKVGGWYASFIKTDKWMVNQVKAADREKVSKVFSKYYTQSNV